MKAKINGKPQKKFSAGVAETKLKTEMKKKGKKPLKKFSKKNDLRPEATSDLEQLSSSKIFILQTEELIGKLQLDGHDIEFISKWLKKFKQVISKLPEDSLDSCFHSAEYPLSFKPNVSEKKFNLIFKHPENIQIIGSHSQQTNLSIESAVDIALILPNEYFKRDDYLNHKIIHKIAAYLMYLKRKLMDCNLGCDLKIIKFKNDPSKPVLSITAEKFKILIHIFPTDDLFKATRFLPNINNIKENNGEPSTHPTPHYNYQISSYITRIQNDKFLNNFYSVNKNLSIALRLLKMWARQRKFDTGFYGFDGFILSYYLVHLMKIHKIQGDLSPYHIVRIFWNHFGNSDLDVNGISLNDKTDTTTLKSYNEFYDLVMIDSTGHCNLLSMISLELYERVKEDSLKSLKLMENPSPETFQKLFLTKIPYSLQYDHVFVLKIDEKQSKTIIEKHGELSDKRNYHNLNYLALRKLVVTVLKQGLGNRINHIVPFSKENSDELCFGIILNSEHAFTIIEKGPEVNSMEANQFRSFWGEKSEIRRFNDGSISESILWCPATAPFGEKRLIVQKIVVYLLQNHFNIIASKIHYIASQFDITIRNINNELNETNEEKCREIIQIFDELSKNLRSMKDLPLEIVSVTGLDSTFRYTDPTPPTLDAEFVSKGKLTKDLKGYFRAQKVVNGLIQLSSSSKWPDDEDAQQRLKAAFYLDIEKRMKTEFPENYTRAGPHCIYVMKSKKFFKLTIIHPKELILEKTNNNIKERKLNNLSIQSRLTSTLHGLYCKYPSFGPAIAITKRWLYSHMIDTLLWPEILTELIFAEMLLNQLTTSTVQPQGLFFNFLNKISNFDPQYEMIVCNFNEELSLEQIEEVERKFRKNRQNFPPIMTFTSLDDDRPSLWTINAPSINVFQHVRLLAQKCFELIEGNFMSLNSKQVSDVFSPSYSGFDVIIHLDSLLLRKFDVHTNFNFTKNAKREQKITPPADIDHAQSLLTELRQAFDEYAVFFLNPVGGNKIAVIFKPLMQKIKKGSVDNTKQSITVETMIHNISLIGQGLVTSIEVFD